MKNQDLQIIEKYFFGYGDIEESESFLLLHRFNKEQKKYYIEQDYVTNSRFPAGIVIRANKCRKIEFDVKCISISHFNKEQKFVLDIISENKLIKSEAFDKETEKISFEFNNEDVILHFPYDAEIGVKNIVIDGEENSPSGKVFCLGDSITQGFMTHCHSASYPSSLARELNVEAHNFGIGGFHFERGILRGIDEYGKPRFVTIAYGTNDWNFEEDFEEEIEIIFKELNEKFSDIPVFVILPLPRKTQADIKKSGTLEDVRQRIKKEAEKYSNFTIFNFCDKIEVERDLCADGIHPNDEGMKRFSELVIKEISKNI